MDGGQGPQADLRQSVAASAQRIVDQLLDEVHLRERAEELRRSRAQEQIRAFRAVVSGLDRRCREAQAVAAADFHALQSTIDTAAAARVGALTPEMVDLVTSTLDHMAPAMHVHRSRRAGWRCPPR